MKEYKKMVLLTLLCGCSTGINQSQLEDRYKNFGCEDLNREYRYVLERRIDAFNRRMQGNNTNLIVSSALGILSKSGRTYFDETSDVEERAEAVLKVLRKEMKTKGCGSKGGCK